MPQPSANHPRLLKDHLIKITGTVQGVGFRPFIARLANEAGLAGWVRNDQDGVTIRVRASDAKVRAFTDLIRANAPPASEITGLQVVVETGMHNLPRVNGTPFEILSSPDEASNPTAAITPDLAICRDCRRELLDSQDRRHRYPFINCTNCGPRYSIIQELPYDRGHTTMARFEMCPDCAAEYSDPLDRRYHAQPNACPVCGPAVRLEDTTGKVLAEKDEAVEQAAEAILRGHIVAVKGIGGFHLFVDARNDGAVTRLRRRKHRDEKPFAVMFPSTESLQEHALVTDKETRLLQSPAAPIVLVKQRQPCTLSSSIAPGNPLVGALLPYTPLHVLLMEGIAGPVIATSANISEEPLCRDNREAASRLSGIADLILSHNRPIARPVDDSVIRIAARGPILLRRARGYAPGPIALNKKHAFPQPILCFGSHLKSTVAVGKERQVILSPHIGDLSNTLSVEAHRETASLLGNLYGGDFQTVACDLHPDYLSTRMAESTGLPVVRVQHHLAHVLACLLEHGGGPEKVLGIAWDGTGFGPDGTIWGGEFLLVDQTEKSWERVAHLRPFALPGGEEAIRKTGRCAFGALHSGGLLDSEAPRALIPDILGNDFPSQHLLRKILQQELNAPTTSSAGRLFDAAAAILGLAGINHFEGQAGMAMEFAASAHTGRIAPYPFHMVEREGSIQADWAPMLEALCRDRLGGIDVRVCANRFHLTLVEIMVAVAHALGVESIVLTGGCFQNALLSDLAHDRLTGEGFKVLLHRTLPPNDNALAAGQAMAVALGITGSGA